MWLIPIVFILLLISGTAFAYLMGAVSVLTFVAVDKTQFLSILPQRIFAQLDVFAFMAMPQFILTAEIMSRSGVSCSSDKPDKEESAGRFSMLWGLFVTAAASDALGERDFDDRRRRSVDLPSMTLPVFAPFCRRRRNVASDFLRRSH